MPQGTSLSGMSVYVTCVAQAAGGTTLYVIRADACNMPAADGTCPAVNNAESVRRTMEAEL